MKALFSKAGSKTNVNGDVETREDGAFKVILGSLNSFNVHNELYAATGMEELLTVGGYHSFASKLKRKTIKGESRHPFREPGMTDTEFVNRNLIVDNTTASHHILEIMLEQTTEVEKPGTNVILIWAWIKPTDNDLGRSLKADLLDKSVNVCFSIRCFSVLRVIDGIPTRIITSIMTWDWVDNPGMPRSAKLGISASAASLTKEDSRHEIEMTEDLIESLKDLNASQGTTTENSGITFMLEEVERLVKKDSFIQRW